MSLAQALVRHRSVQEGVAVELIATQSELSTLVTALRRGEGSDHVRVVEGWRRELVGNEPLAEGILATTADAVRRLVRTVARPGDE